MSNLVEDLAKLLTEKNLTIATAESCTGGLIASSLTHIPGASKFFYCGFITYSNESKTSQLNVPADLIAETGAVSMDIAVKMAEGAITATGCDIGLAVTGIAGPDGGSDEKPVGLVYIGFSLKNGESGATEHNFEGSRTEIQSAATAAALKLIIGKISETA